MRRYLTLALILLVPILLAQTLAASASSSILPATLKTDSTPSPLGIDNLHPTLSWTLTARDPHARNLSQYAVRILVATSAAALARNQGDQWDSGELNSSALSAAYAGPTLQPAKTYYWKIQLSDQDHQPSPWSSPATFSTALNTPWQAHWIAAAPDPAAPTPRTDDVSHLSPPSPPLPIFRRQFAAAKPIRQALVFVTGLGQYELRINGRPVTNTLLNPGWTDYKKTILYNTFDVTSLLRPGNNMLAVLLGNGMYNVEGTEGRYTKFIGSYGQPKLLLELHLTSTDGSTQIITSDQSWQTSPGPITFSSTYGGEDFDATREPPGWDQPQPGDLSAPSAAWTPALEVSSPGGELVSQRIPPIAVDHTYSAVKITTPQPGIRVYDLGQNFAGWPMIRVQGPRGSVVTLTCGELLNPSHPSPRQPAKSSAASLPPPVPGLVSQHSANADPAHANRFTYNLKGTGIETWHPRFSYWGFRYIQVETAAPPRSSRKPIVVSVSGQFLHAAVPVIGHFSTSNLLFSRIHHLIDMAILSNMASILTDCPHREKLGWLEQTHLAGASILFNYDATLFYAKMARDIRDSQLPDGMVPGISPEYVAFLDSKGKSNAFRDSPEWGSAAILSPWTAYQFSASRELLTAAYPSMQAYAHYLHTRLSDHMLTYGLGDWYDIGPRAPGVSQLTSQGMTATATYYQDLQALSQVGALLNHPDDATAYSSEAAEIKIAINRKLFHVEQSGGSYDRNSQTDNAMPLALGLVPEQQQAKVLENLIADIHQHQDHVTAGDIGFHYVVRALTDAGRSEVLNAMLQRTDAPSYGDQLAKGATSLTEAWDTNPDSSQNHFMLGHAEEWFYRGLAGLDFDLSRPAPRQILIRPAFVEGTRDAAVTYDSPLGRIETSWRRRGRQVEVEVSIPPGSRATIRLPRQPERVAGSGRYHFLVEP